MDYSRSSSKTQALCAYHGFSIALEFIDMLIYCYLSIASKEYVRATTTRCDESNQELIFGWNFTSLTTFSVRMYYEYFCNNSLMTKSVSCHIIRASTCIFSALITYGLYLHIDMHVMIFISM